MAKKSAIQKKLKQGNTSQKKTSQEETG